MFKTGSKFLYGMAAFGFVAAIVYAMSTSGERNDSVDTILGPLSLGYKGTVGDHVGFSILVTLAAVSFFMGAFLSALRDADAEAVAQVAEVEVAPDVPAPAGVNYWPIVTGFSVATIVLGLAVTPALFVLGMVGLVIAGVEWAVRAWSDRATGDPETNRQIRNKLMHPLEVPGMAVLGIGLFVLAVSRILLAVPKTGSYLVFGLVPALIFVVGVLIVTRPKVSQSVIAGLLLVGGIAILVGGVAAAIAGPRDLEHHDEEEGGEEGGHRIVQLVDPTETVIRVNN